MEKVMDQSQISHDIFKKAVDLQALILSYKDRIVSICHRYARNENKAEELAQEFIAVNLFEKDLVGKYQKRSTTSIPFRKYLYRAVANHCIDKCRRKSIAKEMFQDSVEFEFARVAQTTNARHYLEWAMSLLHRAFTKLRAYYMKKGKENYWLIFKESILDKALKPFDPGPVF